MAAVDATTTVAALTVEAATAVLAGNATGTTAPAAESTKVTATPIKRCYSVTCKCHSHDPEKWRHKCTCYSLTCRRAHYKSYWKHPSLRAMMVRARISCALKEDQLLMPFASFVPRGLQDYLILLRETTRSRWADDVPFGALKTGSVLFADASGFTRLTERLAKKGRKGVEELCQILNSFFTILVDIVHDYGGDIIKFAGDAVCVTWFIGKKPGDSKTIEATAIAAAQCATEIHRKLHGYVALGDCEEPVTLTLHMGIGSGQLTCVHVGGVFKRWEYVVSGPPMGQIAIAEPLAEPGETVLSPEAWKLIEPHATGTPLGDLIDTGRKHPPAEDQYHFIRLDSVDDSAELRPGPAVPPLLTRKHLALLRRYIPAAIQPKVKAGQAAFLAELRKVSVMFVNIDCSNMEIYATSKQQCDQAIDNGQRLMLCIQEAIYFWEGSINKLLVDDKGVLVVCVFGLPPFPHADDPRRAVGAAQMLIENLRKLGDGIHSRIGVTTGTAFAGVIGSTDRREYTVMGDMVNLSARLMQAAAEDSVLVDEATKSVSERWVEYKALEPMELKGKAKKVIPYCPVGRKRNSVKKKADLSLQARSKEHQILQEMISNNHQGTLVLTGERGSGKSALVEAVCRFGSSRKMSVLTGRSKSKNRDTVRSSRASQRRSTRRHRNEAASLADDKHSEHDATTLEHWKTEGPSFSAWSGVISDLVAGSVTPGQSNADCISAMLLPEHKPYAAMLNLVVPELRIEWPPDGLDPSNRHGDFWNLTFVRRVQLLKKMLVHMIEEYAKRFPTLIVLHLQTGTSIQATVDPESWSLAYNVSQLCLSRSTEHPQLIFCVVSRAIINYAPIEFIEIVEVARKHNMLLQLTPLDEQARLEYLRHTLGMSNVHALPEGLVKYVSDIAAGNPKSIEELCTQLRKEHFITVQDGCVKVHVDDFSQVPIPEKMLATAMLLIDNLQPRHQLIVKVATTCEFFSLKMLRDIFPYEEERHYLGHAVKDLVDAGVFLRHTEPMPAEVLEYDPDATVCYSFQSQLFKVQATKLLLDRDRRQFEQQRHKMALANTVRVILKIHQKMQAWLHSTTHDVHPAQAPMATVVPPPITLTTAPPGPKLERKINIVRKGANPRYGSGTSLVEEDC
eukprot:m.239250 g.239250  ORF g.239250 m.239250 type:complete len:1130 (+) comp18976_c1_seq7:2013-5402(+)